MVGCRLSEFTNPGLCDGNFLHLFRTPVQFSSYDVNDALESLGDIRNVTVHGMTSYSPTVLNLRAVLYIARSSSYIISEIWRLLGRLSQTFPT